MKKNEFQWIMRTYKGFFDRQNSITNLQLVDSFNSIRSLHGGIPTEAL